MASETATPGLQQSLPAAPSPAKGSGRLLFVDNIRIFLTILVILHHLMIIYAGSGAGSGRRAGKMRSPTAWAVGSATSTRPTSWDSFC